MEKIAFYHMDFDSELKSRIKDAIFSVVMDGQFIGGSPVTNFEQNFTDYLNTSETAGCGNGLDALELAINSLNLPASSKIAVSAHTFFATWLAIINCGHVPVGIDADIRTYQMNPSELKKTLKRIPEIRAVIYVHMHGLAGPIQEISDLCLDSNIPLIEDCAQAHGLWFGENHAGTFGDYGTFSFYPTKNLPAFGDAGCVVSGSHDLATIRAMANYGWYFPDRVKHKISGRNSRLDSIQAAILGLLLQELPKFNDARRSIAKKYYEKLINIDKFMLPLFHENNVWHHFPIQVTNRDGLCSYLEERGIPYQINYAIPCSKQEAYIESAFEKVHTDSPVADLLSQNALCLPINPWIKEEHLDRIINALHEWSENEQ